MDLAYGYLALNAQGHDELEAARINEHRRAAADRFAFDAEATGPDSRSGGAARSGGVARMGGIVQLRTAEVAARRPGLVHRIAERAHLVRSHGSHQAGARTAH